MRDLKSEAVSVFLDSLSRIDVRTTIQRRINLTSERLSIDNTSLDLGLFERIVLVAFGKASTTMAHAVEQILGQRVESGIVVTDRRSKLPVQSEVIVAGHPLPNADSLRAGESVIRLLRACGPESLIFFLISGGGSSLVELPVDSSITLEDLRTLNELLVLSGATIREINTVRKRLSRIKGGKLGYLARNSTCVKLFLSDVNVGDIRSLASNPLLPEDAAPVSARQVLQQYDLMDRLPDTLRRQFDGDSPAVDWKDASLAVVLLESTDAMAVAAAVATERGFKVEVASDLVEGPYRDVADELIQRLARMRTEAPGQRLCLISAGEVSCPVHANGIGGRNQEFVLYSAALLLEQSLLDFAVLSCGSDGIDGNSNAAGAVADAEMVSQARALGCDPWWFIRSNDTHSFYRQQGGLVVTGPTGNNVRDMRIHLAR